MNALELSVRHYLVLQEIVWTGRRKKGTSAAVDLLIARGLIEQPTDDEKLMLTSNGVDAVIYINESINLAQGKQKEKQAMTTTTQELTICDLCGERGVKMRAGAFKVAYCGVTIQSHGAMIGGGFAGSEKKLELCGNCSTNLDNYLKGAKTQ